MNTQLIGQFAPVLTAHRAPVVRDEALLLQADGDLKVYYAPFEYINPTARLVLVGITPGPTQMENANDKARHALMAGMGLEQALKLAKETASFSGNEMRSNLIRQLNHWGVQTWLELGNSDELFSTARHMLHNTSLLRYPVFYKDKPYGGNPNMTRHPMLRQYLMDNFVQEIKQLKDAKFFALGATVKKVFDALVEEGVLDEERIIRGLFHPSPQCSTRINYVLSDRTGHMPHATTCEPYDQGRHDFQRKLLAA